MYACAHQTAGGFFAGVCGKEDRPPTFRNPSMLSDRAGVPSVGLQPDQVHEVLGHKLIDVVVVAVVYAVDVL
jgi:hypothetical protein